jgi:hypothetical protein
MEAPRRCVSTAAPPDTRYTSTMEALSLKGRASIPSHMTSVVTSVWAGASKLKDRVVKTPGVAPAVKSAMKEPPSGSCENECELSASLTTLTLELADQPPPMPETRLPLSKVSASHTMGPSPVWEAVCEAVPVCV